MSDQEAASGDGLREQLLRLLRTIDASGRAVLPRQDQALLQSIVEAAARIFGAAAASIALVDEAGETLEFVVSYGAGSESVVGMRIPVNRGIAGYVAMTGQPLATSNVQKDQRFAGDVAQTTGYVPRSILATPLLSGERVIGVMEVLDKISAPSFGMEDMELLGLFARQATMAITQAQVAGRLSEAFLTELSKLAENSGGESAAVDLRGVLEEVTGTLGTGGLVQIADAFYEISSLGESEQRACLEVLAAFARYAKSKTIPW